MIQMFNPLASGLAICGLKLYIHRFHPRLFKLNPLTSGLDARDDELPDLNLLLQ